MSAIPNACVYRPQTGDADLKLLGSATGGSRSLFGVGSVFKLAAEGALEKARTWAACEFGVVLEHLVSTKENPLGAKGVGEAGATGALPAIMNAVLDALRSAGVTNWDSPATPARVWEALRKAAKPSKQRPPRTRNSRPNARAR